MSVEQYHGFVKENPGVDHAENDKYSPDQKGPQNGVTWYHAAAYCNWLSRQEGLPECYEPNPDGRYAAGMKIKPDALRLGGYRLPTEAEWEYACRAGAGTSRYYGASVDLLRRYAWYNATSQDHAWPCGSLLPNELGLFDMLGNMYEWCQDVAQIYQPDRNNSIIDNMNIYLIIDDTNPRILRGGTFSYAPAFVRSAYRSWNAPANRIHQQRFPPLQDLPLSVRLRNEFRRGVHELLAPDVFPVEVSHALTRAERRGVIQPPAAIRGPAALEDAPQRVSRRPRGRVARRSVGVNRGSSRQQPEPAGPPRQPARSYNMPPVPLRK